jgi:DNA topoisomerase-3
MQLVIAEKPSVARDLARVLGAKLRGGAYEGEGRVITWCVGHLVELEEPAQYDGRWKAWRMEALPMLPPEFKLRPAKHGIKQLREVAALLSARRFDSVVNACDAGREGELIFRYVYQYAHCRLPALRLWISSLTDEAIRRGFAQLKPARQYDALGDAARSRSEADWLVGMNATRAITLKLRDSGGDTLFSIGRVQTPTLAMLVGRERAIRAFVPRDYWEVRARFEDSFFARWIHGRAAQLGSAQLAGAIVARCRTAEARVTRVQQKTVREPPPMLFDLTSLQRTANRRFGFSAQRTLDLAQALYERHKVLTYPRTDSRHLTSDLAGELPKLFAALKTMPEYAPFAEPLLAKPPRPNKRVIDDAKVHDHHAIIPTGKAPRALDRDEQRLFDLVVRRFLGVFHADAEFAVTEAWIRAGAGVGIEPGNVDADAPLIEVLPPPPDWFVARGRVRLAPGWQAVAGIEEESGDENDPILPPLAEGQILTGGFEPLAKKTQPPRRYSEATLLSAMETAGRTLSDEELRAAMRETGLGTPATRAAIIETLLKRGYARREQKLIVPTATGMRLIEVLPVQTLASPELTGAWEARLARIARGEDTRPAFMRDIAGYVRETVDAIRGAQRVTAAPPKIAAPPKKIAPPKIAAPPKKAAAGIGELGCPRCKQGTLIAGKRGWGCTRWREGCRFVVWFETAGRTLSEAQLRDLIRRGKTRPARFRPDGAEVEGRLILAPDADGGARFTPL